MVKVTVVSVLVCVVLAGCKKDAANEAKPAEAKPTEAKPAEATPEEPKPPVPAATNECETIKTFTTVEACVAQCEAGDANACYIAGSSYQVGDKVDEDEAKAVVYYTKGCDKASGDACVWLGSMHRNGGGGLTASMETANEIYAKALAIFEPQCTAKVARACSQLASLYTNGWGVAADPEKVKSYKQQACDYGATGACAK